MATPDPIAIVRAYRYGDNDHWTVPLRVDGRKTWALVDSGANATVLSNTLARQWGLRPLAGDNAAVPTAGGLNDSTAVYSIAWLGTGAYELPLRRIHGLDMPHIFSGRYQAVLGLDTLKRLGAFLDICKRRILITRLPNRALERSRPRRTTRA